MDFCNYQPERGAPLFYALLAAVSLTTFAACVNRQDVPSPGDDPEALTRAPNISAVVPTAGQGAPPPECGNPTEPWGPVSGGTELSILGVNFQGDSVFYIGNQRAEVLSVSGDQARIQTPAGRVGLVDLLVVNPNGNFGRKTSAFIYCPEPAHVCINFLTSSGCPISGDDPSIFCPVDSVTAASCPVTASDLTPRVEIGSLLPLRVRVKNMPGGDDLRGVEFCAAPPCDLDDSDDIDISLATTDGAQIALFAGPTPTSRDLLVGESGIFRYDFSALSAGTVQFGVRLSGYNDRLNSVMLFPALGTAIHPATFRLTPLQLTIAVNAERVQAGDQIRVIVNAGNAGSRNLLQVAPATPVCSGDGDATLRFSSVPADAADLPNLGTYEAAEYVFIYEARCEGALSFATVAAALDSIFGNPVVEGVERASPLVTIDGSLASCTAEPDRIDCPRP